MSDARRILCTIFLAGLGDVRFSHIQRNGRAYAGVEIVPRQGDRQLPPGDVACVKAALEKAIAHVDPAHLSGDQAGRVIGKALWPGDVSRGYQEVHK